MIDSKKVSSLKLHLHFFTGGNKYFSFFPNVMDYQYFCFIGLCYINCVSLCSHSYDEVLIPSLPPLRNMTILRDRVFTEEIKVNLSYKCGALINRTNVLIRKGRNARYACPHKKGHGKTPWEGCLQTKETLKASGDTKTVNIFILDL